MARDFVMPTAKTPRTKPLTQRLVFTGPFELERVWRRIAETKGARIADEVLAHDIGLTPSSIAYRRRTGMWEGTAWKKAVEAARQAEEPA